MFWVHLVLFLPQTWHQPFLQGRCVRRLCSLLPEFADLRTARWAGRGAVALSARLPSHGVLPAAASAATPLWAAVSADFPFTKDNPSPHLGFNILHLPLCANSAPPLPILSLCFLLLKKMCRQKKIG